MDEHEREAEGDGEEALTRRAELPRDEHDDPEAEEETRALARKRQEDIGAKPTRFAVQLGSDLAHV